MLLKVFSPAFEDFFCNVVGHSSRQETLLSLLNDDLREFQSSSSDFVKFLSSPKEKGRILKVVANHMVTVENALCSGRRSKSVTSDLEKNLTETCMERKLSSHLSTVIETKSSNNQVIEKMVGQTAQSSLKRLNDLCPGLVYNLVNTEGPGHSPRFTVTVEVKGQLFEGKASRKKKAQQEAAKKALVLFDEVSNGANESQKPDAVPPCDETVDTPCTNSEIPVECSEENRDAEETRTTLKRKVDDGEGGGGPPANDRKRHKKLMQHSYFNLSLVNPEDCVALDCEFVGVGPKGCVSALGRCSIVDFHGNCLLDDYALPAEPVTDYRTRYSGISPKDLINAMPTEVLRGQAQNILKGKILIGHAICHDLSVLRIAHPKEDTRDTLRHPWFKCTFGSQGLGLKRLAGRLLDWDIQNGSHDSLTDARACMELFKLAERATGRLPAITSAEFEKRKRRLRNDSEHSFLEDHYWTPECSGGDGES